MKTDIKGKLKNDGDTGDGKCMFISWENNDGYQDFRIEVNTDDCDKMFAKKMAEELIRRWNSYS